MFILTEIYIKYFFLIGKNKSHFHNTLSVKYSDTTVFLIKLNSFSSGLNEISEAQNTHFGYKVTPAKYSHQEAFQNTS